MGTGYASRPSNYDLLVKLRQSKTVTLKPCPYIKETTRLRYYQVVAVAHFVSLARMILGDGVGLGKCVSEDMYIPTSAGLLRIGDLFPENSAPEDLLPAPDINVLSKEGPSKPAFLFDSGKSVGIRVTTRNGYSIHGLGRHPILVAGEMSTEYRKLSQIKIGDFACINRKGIFSKKLYPINFMYKGSKIANDYQVPKYLTEDFAELLGYYVSEGNHRKYGFTITQHDPEINSRIRALLKVLFHYEQDTSVSSHSISIVVHSIFIKSVFQSVGADMEALSGDQIVPKGILESPKRVIAAFLRGYFEGDGSAEAQGTVSCSSKSEALVNQIQQLILLFGIISRRKKKMVKVGDTRKPYWILYFCGQNVEVFRDEIGFVSKRKRCSLSVICGVTRNTNRDIIPFGRSLFRQAMREVISYLRTLSDQKGFSVSGSGWKGIVGKSYKNAVEVYTKGQTRVTRTALVTFIRVLKAKKLSDHVPAYEDLVATRDADFFYDEVVSITEEPGRFVDFVIPETHNFTGGGFINHNTLQFLAAFAHMLAKDPTLKCLIIVPKSARFQWAEEAYKFLQGITVHVIRNEYAFDKETNTYGTIEEFKKAGKKFKKLEGFEARKAQYDTVTATILISTYFTVQEDYTFLVQNRLPNFAFAMDELQEIKNAKTKTHFGADYISAQATRVYGISATIIKNRLEEAYNLYKVVVPGLFGGKNHFLQEYTIRKKMEIWRKGKKQRFNKIVGYQNLPKFKEMIDPFFLIRRTQDVASELPKLISKKVQLEMTKEQSLLYKEALSGDLYKRLAQKRLLAMKDKIAGMNVPTEADLVKLEELQQKYDESLTKDGLVKSKLAALTYCQLVSNGPGWVGEPGESSKEQEFKRLFEQELCSDKVIVFTRFKSGIKRLEAILDGLGMNHVKITGDDSSEDRDKARKAFQDTESGVDIIFITYAGSAALNLQSARVLLFYDTPWSYGDLYQTIGRAQRIGSIYEHVVLIHMVNEKTIDEHVVKILEMKKSLINDIMGDIAQGAIEFDKGEILFKEDESDIDALYSSMFKAAD